MTEPLTTTVFTIGFARKNARTFFSLLKEARVRTLLDVRLNNSSQLAGYTKRDDLEYFCESVLGIAYRHMTELAPTQPMLDRVKGKAGAWDEYADGYLALLRERRIETLERGLFADACLLCAEPTADRCHRRLVAEYLQRAWPGITIVHL